MTEENPVGPDADAAAGRSTAEPAGPPSSGGATSSPNGPAPVADGKVADGAPPVDTTPPVSPNGPAEPVAASDNGQPPAADTSATTTPPGEPAKKARRGKEKRKGSFWRELPILLVIAFALALVIKTFLVQAFFIPSGSMERTLHGCEGCSGDRVMVNKLIYRFRDPHPGDIVVFRGSESWAPEVNIDEPTNWLQKAARFVGQAIGVAQPNEKDLIKRVIAVGGQTVRCCDPQGRVVVNNTPLDEPYVFRDGPGDQQEFGPVTVPPGRLWVMGDHRNASSDSRAHIADQDNGTVSIDDVIGKAFVIVWPPSRWNTLGTPDTFRNLAGGPLSLPEAPLGISTMLVLPLGLWRWRRQRAPDRSSSRRRPR